MSVKTIDGPVRVRAEGEHRRGRGYRRTLAVALSALLVWTSAAPGIAAAQASDDDAPLVVEHEPPSAGVAGEPLRIEARVLSTGARPFVVLHHRERGEDDYVDEVMPRVGAEGYLRELSTEAGASVQIEYWIEASAGDATAAAGSAGDPFVVDVAPARSEPEPVADTRAPDIVDRPPASASADEAQRFEVEVTDDTAVDEVALFHRVAGEDEFERLPMTALGENGYTATVPADPDAALIEYFVEARDASGNRESLGSRFMPLERPLDASGAVSEPSPVAEAPSAEPRSRTLWYVLGGVLLAGAVAAAAGGGGDSDDDGGDCCTVTIEVDAPQ